MAMTRLGLAGLALCTFFGLMAASQPLHSSRSAGHRGVAPEPQTSLAVCDVLVSADGGAPVTSLVAADFEVLSDGIPVRVVSVAPPPLPLSIVILYDFSTSVTLESLHVIEATQHVVASKPPNVRLRFGAFAGTVKIGPQIIGIRSVRDSLLQMFTVSPREPSPLWDAIAAGMNTLSRDSGLRAVVVISDGRASGNFLHVDEVIDAALLGNYIIGAVSDGREIVTLQEGSEFRLRPAGHLQAMAAATGGEFTNTGPAGGVNPPQHDIAAHRSEMARPPVPVGPFIARMVTSLASRHRVTFEAPADGRFHELEVRTKALGYTTRAPQRFFGVRR